ncbi:Wall-associated receptor kinase 1, partial [Bienertia sinuspersici]
MNARNLSIVSTKLENTTANVQKAIEGKEQRLILAFQTPRLGSYQLWPLQKMREKCFRENGGLILHQKLRGGGAINVFKIFTTQDLESATNNYSDKYIIGRGGFGTVYKGILSNNQCVAIKKSLKVDPNQVEQFINEILILSQINNRNVVKLLGCSLESEVPLLVYEFIGNGTLYDHLDDVVKASMLTWNTRLNIALEVANVLSYLHITISTPIIHRDIKSTNILLDENYTAKVADFGASRLIPKEQEQLATMVLGTWGYLDPEYMQTSELTEKSDVYSFVSEETIEQLQQVANWCLMLKGEDRPTMKEVALELEATKREGAHPWDNYEVGPIQEDSESLLQGVPRLGVGGCSSSIESDLYDPHLNSTLRSG